MIPEKTAVSPAAYVLPRPAGGVRKPSRRSRFSARGTANVRLAGGQHILVDFESVLELAVIQNAVAHPLCTDIRSQAFAVTYTDAYRRKRRHVVDFLVTLSDGRRLAIVVKPAEKAAQPEFRATLAVISAALQRENADELVLVTDHSLSRTETLNAARYLQFLRTVDAEAEVAIRQVSNIIRGSISLGDLAEMTGLGGRAFRAAFRAVFTGEIRRLTSGLITPRTIVKPEALA